MKYIFFGVRGCMTLNGDGIITESRLCACRTIEEAKGQASGFMGGLTEIALCQIMSPDLEKVYFRWQTGYPPEEPKDPIEAPLPSPWYSLEAFTPYSRKRPLAVRGRFIGLDDIPKAVPLKSRGPAT